MSNVQVRTPGQTLSLQGDRDIGHSTFDSGLAVCDLRKTFLSPAGERIEVLRGVSFSAVAGRSVAITGVSGAGKSTLLQLVGGLDVPDHGSIRMGSFEIDRARAAQLAGFRGRYVGFIFQFHHLLADLSAAENVALPLLISRVSRNKALSLAVEALENTGLGARIDHPVGHLSGGEQQRVAVCRALISQPSLVLADEPTGNLDASFAQEIGEILVSYARNCGAIVLVATHNERQARLCDKIMVLRDGRLFESGKGLK